MKNQNETKKRNSRREMLTCEYMKYSKKYKEWKDKFSDDRRIYQNTYEMLLSACDELENVESPLIRLGFYSKFDEEIKVLDRIIERFENMEMAV